MGEKRKQSPAAHRLARSDARYPGVLLARLGENAPATLTAIGPVALLANRKTALFCSARTPGDAILRAHDMARRLRDEGVTVISGFHSPIERECLRILLRGKQPIIICPARAIESMRIATECRAAFDAGRVLFLSPFAMEPRRVTKDSAARRNEFVAVLADNAYVAHAAPGGQTAKTIDLLRAWSVPPAVGTDF